MNRPPAPRVGAVLSLTGRFARFGIQAARGLQVWSEISGAPEVAVIDDESSVAKVSTALRALAKSCDLLLGPYSTVLARPAAVFAADTQGLVWNHGGSGDDVQASAPGHLVSVLAPTSRYADAFVARLATDRPGLPLGLITGPGSFGRQVIAGARAAAGRAGVPIVESDPAHAVFTAGTFEHDTETVARLLSASPRPQVIGSVAAGVQAFADVVHQPDDLFGVAQWIPGRNEQVLVGPSERDFVAGHGSIPDYPAVQAAAAASIAVYCARSAGSLAADDLWAAATALHSRTLFGAFEIHPRTGAQVGHVLPLVRWSAGRMTSA